MSKIIKDAELKDSVSVSVNNRQMVHEYVPVQLAPETPAPADLLGFDRQIAFSIEKWRKYVRDHVISVEIDYQHRLEEAYRSGHEKGMHDGIQKERTDQELTFDARFNNRLRAVEALFAEAKQAQQNWAGRLERKVISLSIAIAETIIKRNLDADPVLVEEIVREALTCVVNSEKLVLKVSPGDYKVISARHEYWAGQNGNAKEFRIESDNRLGPGNCLIETDGGIIDATIQSRLNAIAENFVRVPKGNSSERAYQGGLTEIPS